MSLGPAFQVNTAPVVGVPPTADPKLDLHSPREMIVVVLALSVVIAFVVARYRKQTPTAVALVLDLLPLAWMFFFVWSLVHNVSELIPARKHPMFNRNAIAAAGLFAFVAALLPRRMRGMGVGVIGLVLSFLAMADILHMRIFGNVMPIGSHGSILQLWDVRASIASLFESRDELILLYVATSLAMFTLWHVKEIAGWLPFRLLAYLLPAAGLSLFLGMVKADVGEFLESKWAKEVLNREDQVWNAGFLEAHVREISLNTKHWLDQRKPTLDELAQVERYYRDEHRDHYTANRPSFGQFKGKNVLVLQIEAFEEWLIGATINGQEITPTLNKLRGRGIFYTNMFNLVASSSTADCEYLFLNSNHPLPDGAVAFRREDNHFVTLATTLRDTGYSTLSMHGYRRGMWNRAVLHPRYGFTHSYFGEELGVVPQIGWGLDDNVFFDKVLDQAKEEKAPWFLYAITLSSHHPYNSIPVNRRRMKLGALESSMLGNYIHSAAFVDDALATFFSKLKDAGLLNDTVVVMYGDHEGHLQTSARDRTSLGSLSNVPKSVADRIGTGSWSLNRIPLLILLPGQESPQVARGFGGQLDFAPTVLHYLGIDPPRSFEGHPILPGDVGGFVARWDGSFVAPPLIYDAGQNDCRVLADLRAVPDETCSRLADRSRKAVDMSWRLTNNDLAHWLVDRAQPLKPLPTGRDSLTLGGACQNESDCRGPDGFDVHCLGGVCMTDPKGPCEQPGSTTPCALGSVCAPVGSDLNECAASCDVYACAGECNELAACVPKK